MHNLTMAENSEIWDVICDGPHVTMEVFKEWKILLFILRPRNTIMKLIKND